MPFESSTAAKSESASSQPTKTRGRGRKKTFDVLAAKIVDEKVPIKRKVKYIALNLNFNIACNYF